MFSESLHERSSKLQDMVERFVSQVRGFNAQELDKICNSEVPSLLDMTITNVDQMNEILTLANQQKRVTSSPSDLSKNSNNNDGVHRSDSQSGHVDDVEDDLSFDLALEEELENELRDNAASQDTGQASFSFVSNEIDDEFDDDDDDALGALLEAVAKSAPSNENDQSVAEDLDQPVDPKYLHILKVYFGYSKFRHMQWKIINSILNLKKDNCVVMPTGHGKSLCYQFPSVFSGRTSIVISPLLSLMQDQVSALNSANIPACCLDSSQTNSRSTIEDLYSGEYRFLYITPEYAILSIQLIEQLHKEIGIDVIAIDEAHCVSQWGHDFRSAYRHLAKIRLNLPQIPVVALTATATPDVMKDICDNLKLVKPIVTCTGFNRPNLFLSVKPKSGNPAGDLKPLMVPRDNGYDSDNSTIIYCPTKKATAEICSVIEGFGISCRTYHAGMSDKARKESHRKFINNEIQVVVATIAFGMGIDKRDIRTVIHYGAPRDIESYYQEIGRAGRDGLPSLCRVFHAPADFNIHRFFVKDIANKSFRSHRLKMLSKMETFLNTTSCRRKLLLEHFEDKNASQIGGGEDCCDNCLKRMESERRRKFMESGNQLHTVRIPDFGKPSDYGQEARYFLEAIQMMKGYCGIATVALFLMGSADKKVLRYTSEPNYGIGKYKNKKFWVAFGRALVCEGYLEEVATKNSFWISISVSTKGKSWLKQAKQDDEYKLELTPTQAMIAEERVRIREPVASSAYTSSSSFDFDKYTRAKPSVLPSTAAASSSVVKMQPSVPEVDERVEALQIRLYRLLAKLRNDFAQEYDLPPHAIASNKILLDIVRIRPKDKKSMLKIEEFPQAKVEKYGDIFLDSLVPFCKDNDLQLDNFPDVEFEEPNFEDLNVSLLPKLDLSSLSETQLTSYHLFATDNKSLDEISKARNLKISTVLNHLCAAIEAGANLVIERLGLPLSTYNQISAVITGPKISYNVSRLTQIKDVLPSTVDFNQIKLVISLLKQKMGFKTTVTGETFLLKPKEESDSSPAQSPKAEAKEEPQQQKPQQQQQKPKQQAAGGSGGGTGDSTKRKLPFWMMSKPASMSKKQKP
ncbi:Werner syndrome ATP-dependent helicase-like [Octopus sinensis]|uniref:DNA 3'-5' helicase n=1 Tax=Octopus sinensis TaxID=2607531 RepID=A0A6P7TUQ4_9MOLL|nr:Werner syndrome ATP-dependent helicase-like [Octopus sinensis]